jgi:ATP-dependent Clp protease ATP-binding subunit ClpC
MQVRQIDPGREGPPILIVTGFGAFRTLEREHGLHVLEQDGPEGLGRIAARVVVAPGPDRLPQGAEEPAALGQQLAKLPLSTTIVRRYRERPAQIVRDIAGGWRSGRLDAVLAGDFDLIGAVKRKPSVAA